MKLKKVAEALGVSGYPEALERAVPVDICDAQRITALQEELDFFGNYYEEVLLAARELAQNPERRAWGEAIAGYALTASVAEVRTIPYPVAEGTADMLPLLIHLPLIPGAVASYRSRGFSEEQIRQLMGSYKGCMSVVQRELGVVGLDRRYYNWLFLYAKALIFPHGGFLVEVRSFLDEVVVLKNREDGRLIPVMRKATLHRSGMLLGAAGCEDPEGSRTVELKETEDGFYGCPAVDGKAAGEMEFFSRQQWACVLQPGQCVLSLHLPRGMDISPASVDEALRTVTEKAGQWYPDYKISGIYCGSWLLDPALADILGRDSKIAAYGARFARYPIMSAGREVFSFVFPHGITKLEDLPENTRLERALKKLYLSGGYIHAFSGVIL